MMPGGLSPQWARRAYGARRRGAAGYPRRGCGAEVGGEGQSRGRPHLSRAARAQRLRLHGVFATERARRRERPHGPHGRERGPRDEIVAVRLGAVPAGWKAALKGGQFAVTGVPVTPDRPRLLTFTAEPEKSLPPGTYRSKSRRPPPTTPTCSASPSW